MTAVRLLGRRPSLEACVALARQHHCSMYRLVPLSRGWLVFAVRFEPEVGS